jgi:hypothetical protein
MLIVVTQQRAAAEAAEGTREADVQVTRLAPGGILRANYDVAAAGEITAAPPNASLTLTGKAPTVDLVERFTVAPPDASLTLTGKAPSARLQTVAAPTKVSLTLGGQLLRLLTPA